MFPFGPFHASHNVIGDVSVPHLMASPATTGRSSSKWQRRTLEVVVALLAFAIWGKLAYIGGFRLLARIEGIPVRGSWVIDLLSLFIGVSGSIAGVSALWAVGMRIFGRTPRSLVGKPDDSPEDYPQAARNDEHAASV